MMKLIAVTGLLLGTATAFAPSSPFQLKSFVLEQEKILLKKKEFSRPPLEVQSSQDSNNDKSSIDVMMGKIDIPEEYREEIFRAEANTPAAKDRNNRIAIFGSIALLGIAISSFNAFLSNMRDGADLTPINEIGFGWVSGNPLTSFLFLNKIGGGLALLSAGLGGTMVELEQRTKNENAEKIWAELQRRKAQAEGGQKSKKSKKKASSSSKKRMSKKNRKRLDALSEVVFEEDVTNAPPVSTNNDEQTVEPKGKDDKSQENEAKKNEGDGGIFGKVKEFYDKADTMAQSQALLLNKELEDRGVVEKITDETGLKVIGKDAAAKLQSKDDKKINE